MSKLKRLPLVAALALLVVPATALASNPGDATVTGTVTAGTLGIDAGGATPSFGITLDGTNQTGTYTIPSVLTDATGSGDGWNVTIAATQFDDGSGDTLDQAASKVTSVPVACHTGSTCTDPTNATSPIDYTGGLGFTADGSSTVKILSADATTGAGKFDVTPHVSVSIPANTHAGAYTSTVTLAAVDGP